MGEGCPPTETAVGSRRPNICFPITDARIRGRLELNTADKTIVAGRRWLGASVDQ